MFCGAVCGRLPVWSIYRSRGLAIYAMAPKSVNRPCSGRNLSCMRCTSLNEVLFSNTQRDALPIYDQRIATLYHQNVFIEIVNMCLGVGVFIAGPEGHLAAIHAIENIALNPWCCLIACCNPVPGCFMNQGIRLLLLLIFAPSARDVKRCLHLHY